jgi:hypothetical protein
VPHGIRIAGSLQPGGASLQAQPGGHQSRCYFSSPHHPGPLRCAAPGNHSAREPQSRTPHAQLSSARPPPPVLPRPPCAPSPAPRRAGCLESWSPSSSGRHGTRPFFNPGPALSSPALHCIALAARATLTSGMAPSPPPPPSPPPRRPLPPLPLHAER